MFHKSPFRSALLAVALLACLPVAHAGQAPAVTFTASVTSANGQLATRLDWAAPGATACVASGHASWGGNKAASGTQTLPAITLSGTYNLTLSCSFPGESVAALSWAAPTANTDGTPLEKCASQTATGWCLRSYRLFRGPAADNMTEHVDVNDRNATSYNWTGLAVGTHYFTIAAVNGEGLAGVQYAPPRSKVIISGTAQQASVTLTVNPLPGVVPGFNVL